MEHKLPDSRVKSMTKIRTRYAPSPTGKMHVGNLRTALYAYLIAKHEGGDFILRIEDTDQERFVEGATEIIYNTMRDTGLKHDEGPDIGGPVGPYVQSDRQKQGISHWGILAIFLNSFSLRGVRINILKQDAI